MEEDRYWTKAIETEARACAAALRARFAPDAVADDEWTEEDSARIAAEIDNDERPEADNYVTYE